MSDDRRAARAIAPGELKALVRVLVKAVGGQEAAGVTLGVSHQRIGQLMDVNLPDQMGLLQISQLEQIVGRAIVTGAAARAADGDGSDEGIMVAAVGTVGSSAQLVALVHAMEADGHRTAAEKKAVQKVAQDNLREAQEAADAAARL